MRPSLFILIAAVGALEAPAPAIDPPSEQPAPASLSQVEGFGPDGTPSKLWLEMVHRLRGGASAPITGAEPTAGELAWARLIASRLPAWEAEIPGLAKNFEAIEPPATARIVIGREGAEDAFTHDEGTIGFDVARLHAAYGAADLPENSARIDRLFRHEYVHLLQKRWLQRHPHDARTPVDLALLGIWTEGLGNYYSLSGRWIGPGGALSDHALATLETLSPRLVDRMAALRCATPKEAARLMADHSSGPFDQKWGALPAALWLAAEFERSPGALRRFVEAGPSGTWELVLRNLSEPDRTRLREALETDRSCERGPGVEDGASGTSTGREGQAPSGR